MLERGHQEVGEPPADRPLDPLTALAQEVALLRAELRTGHETIVSQLARERKAIRFAFEQLEGEVFELRRERRRGSGAPALRALRGVMRLVGTTLRLFTSPRAVSHLASWIVRGRGANLRAYAAVARAGAFDRAYYLRTYPDVARARLEPILHYAEHGAAEGRRISAGEGTSGQQHGARRNTRVLVRKGAEAFRRGSYRIAERQLRAAVAGDADFASGWLWLARVELKLGDIRGSRDSIRHALAIDPASVPARLHLADVLARLGQEEDALEVLDGIHADAPEDADVLRRLVNRYYRMGRFEGARRSAYALLELAPDDETAYYTLAAAAWAEVGDEAGRETAAMNAQLNTSAARAAVRVCLDFSDPFTAWQIVKASAPESFEPALLISVARELRKGGWLADALEGFERVAGEMVPASVPKAHEALHGEVRLLRGEWSAARTSGASPYTATPGRVLHVVGKSLPHTQTGYTLRTHYLTTAQRNIGLDPHVVTQIGFPLDAGVEAPSARDIVGGIVQHRLIPSTALAAASDVRMTENLELAAQLVKELKPGALHAASDFRNGLLALELGRAFDLPVIYEARGFWEETWRSKQGAGAELRDAYLWRRERELECLSRADAVVTLGEAMKAELIDRGVAEEKIVVVRNAVDVDAFAPTPRDEQLAEALGIGGDDVVLGYISSLARYEGVEYLVSATAALVHRDYPVKTLIVGTGDDLDRLVALADELGVSDRVLFPGRVPHDEILKYYGLIDVFVVPRTADRVAQLVTPLKPFEAMATARALVVSGLPALREIIVEGVSGVSFIPEDADDLARVIVPLVESSELRGELGRKAREWVCSSATWEQNGRRYRDLYASLGVAL